MIKQVCLGLTVSLYPTINDCINQSHRHINTKPNITITDYTTTKYNFITTEEYKRDVSRKLMKKLDSQQK